MLLRHFTILQFKVFWNKAFIILRRSHNLFMTEHKMQTKAVLKKFHQASQDER